MLFVDPKTMAIELRDTDYATKHAKFDIIRLLSLSSSQPY
jgi:hypothetical protein